MTERRFSRQVVLPEVGVRGQAALSNATFVVPSDLPELAARVARRYATGAGFGNVTSAPESGRRDDSPLLSAFRHASSRAVAEGALHVLGATRSVLELER